MRYFGFVPGNKFKYKLSMAMIIIAAILFVNYSTKEPSRITIPRTSECYKIRQRAIDVQKVCEENHLRKFTDKKQRTILNNDTVNRPWFYPSPDYYLLYCQIPKTGSTQWLRVLAVLNGFLSNVNDMPNKTIHTMVDWTAKPLRKLTVEQRNELVKKQVKFVVVRNPLDRLLSAYKDKLENPDEAFEQFGKEIVEFSSFDKDRIAPTFNEFLSFIVQESTSGVKGHVSLNRHWKDFYTLCYPCDVTYDYVITVENLERESNCLLRGVNAPKNLTFPDASLPIETNPRRIRNGLTKKDYYDTVEPEVMQEVIELYEKDFKLFGYDNSVV